MIGAGIALSITAHAVERYQQRVANLPDDLVRAALSNPAVERAASFGAPFVRLPGGQRIVLAFVAATPSEPPTASVVTVLPAGHLRGRMGTQRTYASNRKDQWQ